MPQPGDRIGFIILASIILIIGLISLFFPKVFWWLRIGRRAKDIPGTGLSLRPENWRSAYLCCSFISLLLHILSLAVLRH